MPLRAFYYGLSHNVLLVENSHKEASVDVLRKMRQ